MKTLTVVSFALLVFAAGAPSRASAQCPEGKVPLTMVTPSGVTKTLCVSASAVQGIETAADNSATTVVPAACPKECWTQGDIAYWDGLGDLRCWWGGDPTASVLTCAVKGGKTPFVIKTAADGSVCSNIAAGTASKVFGDEAQACIALLEPFVAEVAPCPCAGEFAALADKFTGSGLLRCGDVGAEGSRVLSLSVTDGYDVFSFYPGSNLKMTCGAQNTSLFELRDAEAQGCIDLLNEIIAREGLICSP